METEGTEAPEDGGMGLTIVRLEASNVKRIKAVEITPSGSSVVIGGKNGQGKSSVLDAIMYALAGKRAVPAEPVRHGTKKAEVVVDLGELIVRRSFTESGGGVLTVTAKNGEKYGSPQAVLDKLCGELTFDPLAFARAKPREQAEILRRVTGLDFAEIDARRADLVSLRSDAKRDAQRLRVQLGALVIQKAPEEPVDVADLMAELEKRREINRTNGVFRAKKTEAETALKNARAWVVQAEEELRSAIASCAKVEAEVQEIVDKVAALVDADVEEAQAAVVGAGEVNHRVEMNRQIKRSMDEAEALEMKAGELGNEIADLDAARRLMIENADLPVKGLAFADDGVTFRGVPFEQASHAEQVKVSVALGLVMNPKIRVLLVRDGSLLDEDSLGMVAAMAAKKGAQVWIERVSEGAECSVVMENGAVRD